MTIHTPDWVRDAIFYQIFPDRFAKSDRVIKPSNLQPWGATPTYNGFQGGDLLGVVEKLDYLVDLGINAIYFNPIFSSASNHRYHTHDYFQIDPLLGGETAFRELLHSCHARGIKVVLDGVFNHASRGFFQFNHLLECGAESPYVDWFHPHQFPLNAYAEGEKPNYSAWWDIPALPKLNTDNTQVREMIFECAEFWLRKGIDGWRLDVPQEIDDDDFWREFRRRCLAINPDCYIVAEIWEDSQRWLQGDMFDAVMNYVFTRATFGFFLGDNINREETEKSGYKTINTINGHQFAGELDRIHNHLYDKAIVDVQLNMLGSHDTPRLMTVAGDDREMVKNLFLAQMTVPGAPNIYYGDEIGMKGGHDPYCRYAFPWNDFSAWDDDLRHTIQRFIKLRHESKALRRGSFRILHAEDDITIYSRRLEDEVVVVFFNRGETDWQYQLPSGDEWPQNYVNRLGEDKSISAKTPITLAPKSGSVYSGSLDV